MTYLLIPLLLTVSLFVYTLCRASSKCGRAEREREDEIVYLELLLRSDEEPRG